MRCAKSLPRFSVSSRFKPKPATSRIRLPAERDFPHPFKGTPARQRGSRQFILIFSQEFSSFSASIRYVLFSPPLVSTFFFLLQRACRFSTLVSALRLWAWPARPHGYGRSSPTPLSFPSN